jgi:hypothetical protein
MENSYSYEKRKRLADKISKIKRKEHLVKVLEIIYQDNKDISENDNGLFLFFHKLNNGTYHKIDLFLRSISKKKTSDENISETTSDKKEFSSYIKNEFPDQEKLDPKLKYSNKEKNLIKRQRYTEHLNSETNSDQNIVYQKFDACIMSDSDCGSEKNLMKSDSQNTVTNEIKEITDDSHIEQKKPQRKKVVKKSTKSRK